MHDNCKYEDELKERRKIIFEMSGDLKALVAEFRAMNGKLVDTSANLAKHESESDVYRRRIDVVWTVVHTLKWILIFTVGYGAGRPIVEALLK